MIIINDEKELTKNMQLKEVPALNIKGWVMEFDDDITINCEPVFDRKKYCKILIAKNIIFKKGAYIHNILAEDIIVEDGGTLSGNRLCAKKIVSPNILFDYVFCDEIKAKSVICSEQIDVKKSIDCEELVSCKGFSCQGKVNVKKFNSNDVCFLNLSANNNCG